MTDFVNGLHITNAELKNLKINGISESDIISVLKETYNL